MAVAFAFATLCSEVESGLAGTVEGLTSKSSNKDSSFNGERERHSGRSCGKKREGWLELLAQQ